MSTQTNAVDSQATASKIELGVFGGKYGPACDEIFGFLTKEMELSESKSHRIAHAYACDYGAEVKRAGISEAKAKAGRTTKTGSMSLRETIQTTVKNAQSTPALQVGHAIQWIADAGKHGVSYGNTDWQFAESLTKWIASLPE